LLLIEISSSSSFDHIGTLHWYTAWYTVSQAYFALHETFHEVQNFLGKSIFGTKVTSEAFSSFSQNLKVTRLQGGSQTKL
jgi:hypothetical protein